MISLNPWDLANSLPTNKPADFHEENQCVFLQSSFSEFAAWKRSRSSIRSKKHQSDFWRGDLSLNRAL
jgi:hypothetical protein